MRDRSQLACTFSTTFPRICASAMPAAIQTISSSTIRHGVGFHAERKAAPKRSSSRPVCNAEWKRKACQRQQMRCEVLRFRPTSGLEVPCSIPLLSRLWMRFALSSPTLIPCPAKMEILSSGSVRTLVRYPVPGSFSRHGGVVALRRRTHRADAAGCSRLWCSKRYRAPRNC
jgi:hypothetical protein